MKRFSKIFVVVLAVSLIFGALAMTSAALVNPPTPGGMYHKLQNKFDGNAVGALTYTGTNTGVVADTGSWKINNAHNTVNKISIAEGENGNKYLLFTERDNGNVYVSTGYGGANIGQGKRPALSTDGATVTDNNDVTTRTPFVVCDVDVMSPTGKFINTYFGIELRTFKAGDTGIDQVYIKDANGFEFTKGGFLRIKSDDNGESYLCSDADATKKMVLNPYEFTRLTFVLEGVDNPNGELLNDTVNVYVYVNGKLFIELNGVFPNWGYAGDKPVLTWDEFRINVETNKNDRSRTIALDNLNMYCAGVSYVTKGGNLGSVLADATIGSTLEDYDGYATHVENQGAIPFGTAIAQVGETPYDDFADALAAVEEGGTLELLKDVAGTVQIDKEMTITTNGYSIDIEPGVDLGVNTLVDGVITVENIAGKVVNVTWDDCLCDDDHYGEEDVPDAAFHPLFNNADVALYSKFSDVYNPTFEGLVGGVEKVLVGWELDGVLLDKDAVVTPEILDLEYAYLTPVYSEYVEITWKDNDGAVLGTSRALQGTTATVPSNLVGKVEVEGFLRSIPAAWDNLEIAVDAETVVITAVEDCERTLYADVDFYISIREQFNTNIRVYAPIPDEGLGIEVSSFKVNTTERWNAANTTIVTMNGKQYKLGQGWIPLNSACQSNFSITMTFTYGGVQYTDEVSYNFAKYAQTILDTEGFSEEAYDYAVNFANFLKTSCEVMGGTNANYEALKAIVDNNTTRLITIDPATAAKVADPETFAKYVASAKFVLGGTCTYTITYTAEGAALAGAADKVYSNTRVTAVDEMNLTFGEYKTAFTIENLIAYSYGNVDDTTINFMVAMYGYVKAHVAYNS